MKKTFIILFLILVACSNSPENAIEKCTDIGEVKSYESTSEYLCEKVSADSVHFEYEKRLCEAGKRNLIEMQELIKQSLDIKLNDVSYASSFRQCEREYEATPVSFMNKWGN